VNPELSRLSPLRINDSLIRGQFYREAMAGNSDWDHWEISEDEKLRPDLIALRVYKNIELVPLIIALAGIENPLDTPMEVGSTFQFPPVRWIRARIRHYEQLDKS
jgi:hypothetical protein